MNAALRFARFALIAATLAGPTYAQVFEYGRVYGYTAGTVVDGILSDGTILSTGYTRASSGFSGGEIVPGLAQAHYVDFNPAGGFYDVELDVPAGKIHSSIQSPSKVYVQTATDFLNRDGNAWSHVSFQDRITITAPTVGYQQWPILTLHAHLDGSLTAGTSASVDFRSGFGGAGVYAASPGSSYRTFARTLTIAGATASYDELLTSTATVQFAGPGSQVSILLEGYLTTTAANGGSADFQNTASFTLELPPGYTYTAAMGFATAVPEPTNNALVAGVVLLGLAGWRCSRAGRRAEIVSS